MQDNKRGKNVALGGLMLQLALTALAAVLWWGTRAAAAGAAFWLTLAPVPIWLLTAVLFYCRFLQRREAIELEQLAARGGGAESIFAGPEGQPSGIRVAADRLRWMEKYLTPALTLGLAGYHVALGAVLMRAAAAAAPSPAPVALAWVFLAVGMAFAAFLLSRYATGMAKVETWTLLRAPGSYLFTNAVVFFLLAGVVGAQGYWPGVGVVAAYVLPAFMIAIGVELVLNFVLQLYQPRVPGAERRFSYDSRMLNLIAQPESIGHSIAEALNYQFGFEVSRSWFYRLLQRAFVPLLLTGGVVIWLMTGVLIVEEGQEYVVLHWGRPRYEVRDGVRRVKTLPPRRAPYLIWPWPIDTARRFDTGRTHEVLLGVGGQREERPIYRHIDGATREVRVYLWGEDHGPQVEADTLVAVPPATGTAGVPPPAAGATQPATRPTGEVRPAVAIIKLVVGVHYRITDAGKFGYTVTDAPKVIEEIAHREMVQYAASATLDTPLSGPGAEARPQAIMSTGRAAAAAALKDRITRAVNNARFDLGVEIVRVDLLACHPPKEAAPAFEKVIAAERGRDRQRYEAQAEANGILADVAGQPAKALRLAQAINFVQRLEEILTQYRAGADAREVLTSTLAQLRNDAELLRKEIDTERLLGRLRPDEPTVAQELLARQQEFMGLLEGALAAPKEFDPEKAVRAARQAADDLLAGAGGQAAVEIARAWAYRWKTEFRERARAEAFPAKLAAERAAGPLYELELYLQALTEGLAEARKYVLAGIDRERVELWVDAAPQPRGVEEIPFGRSEEAPK